MTNDRVITISTAGSRWATFWPSQKLLVSELYEKLRVPARSSETLDDYISLPKRQQDDLKDVGGYVGGELANGVRKAAAIMYRDIITLDLDNIPSGKTEDIILRLNGLGCGFCVYSTRKHSPAAPRLRVILPISRSVSVDEYEPISRKIAWYIQPEMSYFDKTTFEASRLMYWPSCCSDSIYVYKYADKPFLSADGILNTYNNWSDMSEWPQVPGVKEAHQRMAKKQTDPESKPGVIGAFCRTYNIYSAIEKFIPGTYEPVDTLPGRYTYTGGSTSGGAIIYEDGKFLYSHHATDPASGVLCNAFDLIRLHLYGDLDNEAKLNTPNNKLPSYKAMCERAVADEDVAALINKERHESAVTEFNGLSQDDDLNWMTQLKTSPTTGAIAKTTDNILIILENDSNLKGRYGYDDFTHKNMVLDTLPWSPEKEGKREWCDEDEAGIRWYLEHIYDITGKDKILDALAIWGRRHAFDDLKSYLSNLVWDGVERLDRMFVLYLGAADNEYTYSATRKAMVAAVARTFEPGCKFDNMVILTGRQGIGKSTMLRTLGRRKWFTDSLRSFEGKEVCELIQGMWIVEISELEALNKSEVGRVKQILSQTTDRYRAAYGRNVQDCPRRCVFFGTCNNSDYLRDRTGNRRFWSIDTGIIKPQKNIFAELESEIDMIWAEAVYRYSQGEPLYLEGKAAELAEAEQEGHREISSREGLITDFLERKIPVDWDGWKLSNRLMYWGGNIADREKYELIERNKICALEIWCELFGGDFKSMRNSDAIEINRIISSLPDWERQKSPRKYGYCGSQRGFSRCNIQKLQS